MNLRQKLSWNGEMVVSQSYEGGRDGMDPRSRPVVRYTGSRLDY